MEIIKDYNMVVTYFNQSYVIHCVRSSRYFKGLIELINKQYLYIEQILK